MISLSQVAEEKMHQRISGDRKWLYSPLFVCLPLDSLWTLFAARQWMRREYEVPRSSSLHYLHSVVLIKASSPGNALWLQGYCIGLHYARCFYYSLSLNVRHTTWANTFKHLEDRKGHIRVFKMILYNVNVWMYYVITLFLYSPQHKYRLMLLLAS